MKITNNKKEARFEILIEKNLAYLAYKLVDNQFIVNTVQVPDALGGQGLGKKLAYKAIEFANKNNYEISSNCDFFSSCFERYNR